MLKGLTEEQATEKLKRDSLFQNIRKGIEEVIKKDSPTREELMRARALFQAYERIILDLNSLIIPERLFP